MTITETELYALVGHRFSGGHYRIERWENWLLTDCTGRDPLPDALVHPVALFHAPILGVGTSITELFELGRASGAGSAGLESYDWEYFQALRENIDYRMRGGICAAERRTTDDGRVYDRVAFEIELFDADQLVARITNCWRFYRKLR